MSSAARAAPVGRLRSSSQALLIVALAALSLALAATAVSNGPGSAGVRVDPRYLRPVREPLSALPSRLRAPASAAIGAASSAYRARTVSGGAAAVNPAQHLTMSFHRASVSVTAGATRLVLG